MTLTLRQKQSAFVRLVARLVQYAESQGYELTFGEAWRPPEMVAIYAKRGSGSTNSLHPERLAIDLNLFKDGKYLRSTEAHRPLGVWWELQSTLDVVCAWGGHFGDGNHYSVMHGRRK